MLSLKPLLFAFFVLCLFPAAMGQMKQNQGKVSPRNFSETVDFELWQDHIYLDVIVNGVKGTFMFDNGFSVTGLDSAFAEKCGLNIRSIDKQKVRDANNVSQEVPFSVADNIKIGAVEFKKTTITVVNSKNLVTCKKVDGFIGNSVINKANWYIDFDHNKIQVSSKPIPVVGIQTPYINSKSNRHFIAFNFGGQSFFTHIDLGSGSELEVNQAEFLSGFHAFSGEQHLGVSSMGLFGLGSIDTFYILKHSYPFRAENSRFSISPVIEFQKNIEQPRLGMGYLQQFNLVINASLKQYIFQTRTHLPPPLPDLDYGIVFFPINGVYKILQLISNPNVVKYRFSLLEEIEALDGQPMSQFMDWCLLRTYIRGKIKEKANITLKIKGRPDPCVLEPLPNINLPFGK
jgi:hypothetical protein